MLDCDEMKWLLPLLFGASCFDWTSIGQPAPKSAAAMESLGRLADNLPRNSTNALNAAEAGLQSAFRGSALAITTLLRAAQNSTKKGEWAPCPECWYAFAILTDSRLRLASAAFEAGYSAALQDIQEYLQQGLDVNQGRPSESIAHIIDYIEVRVSGLG